MSKNATIAACLCGLMWAGTAQAGFLNKSFELSFLGDFMATPSINVTGGNSYDSTDGLPNGVSVGIGDTTVTLTVPDTTITNPVGIKLQTSDMIDPIQNAVGMGSYYDQNNNVTTVGIQGINSGGTYTADFTFATVPEPGALPLTALGLMILGVTSYRRKKVAV